eukprot:TRINITY_DN11441_c0_g1_i2.p1 TRINITY_DN11441_c0_g1~~TRINITY_DN11441_c0_g1_i2.p1  ORF type:complete len:400 (+),score=105.06 TRINITY_DN11441_c0_g1_i2:149-1348(+)
MGSTEKFCLKWNDFESNISHSFRQIREEEDFFDLSLACDDDENHVSAHKVVLSACSPFFKSVLRRHKHAHPLLYLKGIKYADLTAVLTFMYNGEVNVAQEDLNSFLSVAEELKVKGLTQQQIGEDEKSKKKSPSPPSSRPSLKSKSRDNQSSSSGGDAISQPSPVKKSRPTPTTPSSSTSAAVLCSTPLQKQQQQLQSAIVNNNHNHNNDTEDDEDEIQEIIPVKSEPRASLSNSSPMPITPTTTNSLVAAPPNTAEQSEGIISDNNGTMDGDGHFLNQQGFATGEYLEDYGDSGGGGDFDEGEESYDGGQINTNSSNIDANKDVEEYMQCLTENGVESWQCLICYKICKRKFIMKDHISSLHQGQRHTCHVCYKQYATRNSLQNHISTYHTKLKPQSY